ncbi:hypothetical protein Tco_1021652, partial [Tanacetum coccineum]
IDIQYRRECEIRIDELKQDFNGMSIEIRKKDKELLQQDQAAYVSTSQWFNFIYDDDDDEESSIPLSDHLDTILVMESDEVIKSSVEDLVPIPSESEGIPDNMCDVPFHDNSPPLDISKDQFEEFSDSNDDSTSIDDDSFSIDDIDYVNASPPESELRGALKDNPTPSFDFVTKSPSTSPNSFLEETNISYNSLPDSETFCFNLEERSSGNPTFYTDLSLPDYEAFFCDSELD